MNRRWIALAAAVALFAQSASMAWASTGAAVSHATAAAEQAMPCHGQSNGTSTGSGTAPDCCNGDCIFMCGGAPLPAGIQLVTAEPPDHVFLAAPVLAPLASHTLTPFRPPAA